MAYLDSYNKVLTKQQWDSLPAYKKSQMRRYSPDFYNYYQKRYEPKVEPVTQKRTIEAEREPVVWRDYDLDGDGYLSPSEYSAYTDAGGITTNAVPRITQAQLDALEQESEPASAVDDEGQAPLDPAVVKYVNKFLEDNGLEPSKWPAGNSITNRDGSPLDADGDGIISPAELRAANITPEAGFNADFFLEAAATSTLPSLDSYDPKEVGFIKGLLGHMGAQYNDRQLLEILNHQFGDGQSLSPDTTDLLFFRPDGGMGILEALDPSEFGGYADYSNKYVRQETEAALIAAAETGDIDVIQEILSTAGNIVSDAAKNAVLNAVYTATLGDVVPAGFAIGSGGSSGKIDFGRADLTDLTQQYLEINGAVRDKDGKYKDADVLEAQRMAFEDHINTTIGAKDAAKEAAARYGGNWYEYYQLPNRAVELSQEFKLYDTDGDGTLSTQEMAEYQKDWEEDNGVMRFADGTSARSETAKAADLNGDGKISQQELAAWESARASDIDPNPNPAMTAFLEDLGFDATPGAIFLEQFNRESGNTFTSGAAQILQQSIQDASLGLLNAIQQGMLTQVESGESTVTRPTLDKDDPSYAIIGQDIDSYLDRIFAGKDTISRDALLTNDEFYDVGIRLATSIQQLDLCVDSECRHPNRTDTNEDSRKSLCSSSRRLPRIYSRTGNPHWAIPKRFTRGCRRAF
jgi:hypothetical protein